MHIDFVVKVASYIKSENIERVFSREDFYYLYKNHKPEDYPDPSNQDVTDFVNKHLNPYLKQEEKFYMYNLNPQTISIRFPQARYVRSDSNTAIKTDLRNSLNETLDRVNKSVDYFNSVLDSKIKSDREKISVTKIRDEYNKLKDNMTNLVNEGYKQLSALYDSAGHMDAIAHNMQYPLVRDMIAEDSIITNVIENQLALSGGDESNILEFKQSQC